jgi:hypothetical protein
MASIRTTSISSASFADGRFSVGRYQTINSPSLRKWLDEETQRQWEERNSSTHPNHSQAETDLRTIFEYAPRPTSSPSESSTDVASADEPHSLQPSSPNPNEQAWLSVHCAAKGPMAPPPPSPGTIPANELRPTRNQSLVSERNRSRCESLASTRSIHEVGISSISGCPMGSADRHI